MTGFAGADRRQWWGFTDLGPIQIPPNPQYLVLTDRVTGVLWWVTFTNAVNPEPDGLGHVMITDKLPADPPIDRPTKSQIDPVPHVYNNIALYPAFGEPVVGLLDDRNIARIVVSNSDLGISAEPAAQGSSFFMQAAPLYVITRIVGFTMEYVRIDLVPGSTITNPQFTWTTFVLTQTPNPPLVNSMANLSNPKADV